MMATAMRLYRDPDVPGRLDFDRGFYRRIAEAADRRRLVHDHTVPNRSGYAWPVRAGGLVRIVAIEGPQVCDLNLWNLNNPRERFWAARTRQLQGAHVTTFDRLWSCLPYLRPIATITNDTLPTEPTANGGRCHDLLGSRCDPYLYKLLDDRDYNVTCHNNLSRAIAQFHLTELDVHDVLNIFQVTGLDPVHEIYFMEPYRKRCCGEPTRHRHRRTAGQVGEPRVLGDRMLADPARQRPRAGRQGVRERADRRHRKNVVGLEEPSDVACDPPARVLS